MTDLREALEHILDGPPPTVVLAGPFAKALVDVAVAAEEHHAASVQALMFQAIGGTLGEAEATGAAVHKALMALDAALARLRVAVER